MADPSPSPASPSPTFTPAPVLSVRITSPFWTRIQSSMRTRTLPAIIDSLRTTGRAYALTWTTETAPRVPHPFWDSDVYKTLEACCYYLMKTEDALLRAFVDGSVGIIGKAQHEDGYINSHYTVLDLSQRFTNLRDRHELYQLGHLCEAAVAHRLLTGTSDLLTPALKYVSLVARTFGPGPGQKRGYPGHEEVEIGLMRLWALTGRRECLDLAGFFILERGTSDEKGEYYYDHEARARGADPYDAWSAEYKHFYAEPRDYAYQQAHKPLVEQDEIVGHSVRAMYYLIASTDYALASGNSAVLAAVKRLYSNTVRQKMYLTGGIGSLERSEGFTTAYWLPDQEEGGCAYAETCASFALALLSQRLLRAELNGEYGDVLETAVYNAVLGAVGAEGLGGGEGDGAVSFYYQNPLTTFAGHGKDRSRWFDVACCPPNVAKLFGLLPELAYSASDSASTGQAPTVAVHFFVSSEWTTTLAHGGEVTVRQETGMPWAGDVVLSLTSSAPVALAVRVPGWASATYTVSVSGSSPAPGSLIAGYYHLPARTWRPSERVTFHFPCTPRMVFPHPRTGKYEVALCRGPLVYCAEGVDNPGVALDAVGLETAASASPVGTGAGAGAVEELPPTSIAGVSGVPVLVVRGREIDTAWWEASGALYTDDAARVRWGREVRVRMVPFFLRANRGGDGGMRVWLKRV